MKLILTRHAKTIENEKGILQGHSPGRLSEKGIKQAKKLALRLKNEKIDYIYSSDLARAADTAKEIIKYHPFTSLYLVKELRERNFGSLTDKKKKEVDWDKLGEEFETRVSMQKRAKKILNEVYKEHPNATIVFVGHGGFNRVLITVILGKSLDYYEKIDSQSNTAVNVFEIKGDRNNIVHLMNCVKHLN